MNLFLNKLGIFFNKKSNSFNFIVIILFVIIGSVIIIGISKSQTSSVKDTFSDLMDYDPAEDLVGDTDESVLYDTNVNFQEAHDGIKNSHAEYYIKDNNDGSYTYNDTYCEKDFIVYDFKGITNIDCVSSFSFCYVRERIKIGLEEANNLIKNNPEYEEYNKYNLQVTNSLRTYYHQVQLREMYGTRAARPSCSAPHVLGKAVDVVLVDKNGAPAPGMESTNMGDMTIGYRQILEDIMCEAGFIRYSGEFWHYEIETRRYKDNLNSDGELTKCSAS